MTTKPEILQTDIFIVYAQEDENYKKELEQHLTVMKRLGGIRTISFGQILAGENKQERIAEMLTMAEIVLFIITPNFFSKDVLWKIAVEQINNHNKLLIPIYTKPVLWKDTALAKLKTLPLDSEPISKYPDRDEAWRSVAFGIRDAVKQMRERVALENIVFKTPSEEEQNTYSEELTNVKNELVNIQEKELRNFGKKRTRIRLISRVLLCVLSTIGITVYSPFSIGLIFMVCCLVFILSFAVNAISKNMIWRKNIRKRWIWAGTISSFMFVGMAAYYFVLLGNYSIKYTIGGGNAFDKRIVIADEFKDNLSPEINKVKNEYEKLEYLIRLIGGPNFRYKLYDTKVIRKREIILRGLLVIVLTFLSISILTLTELTVLPSNKEYLDSLI